MFYGIVGSVGDAISVMKPDVYVSDDGGYTWIKALDGPHHYAILDSGGLLVAVEQSPHQAVNQIKWVRGAIGIFWCLIIRKTSAAVDIVYFI